MTLAHPHFYTARTSLEVAAAAMRRRAIRAREGGVYSIAPGDTDQSVTVHLSDEYGTDKTDLAHTDLTLKYRRAGGALVAVATASLASVDASHTDGGIIHLQGGEYRVDLPDAACAAGVPSVQVFLSATDTIQTGGAAVVSLTAQQTGDTYARLGAPAGASIAADLVTIAGQTDDLETRFTATRAGYLDNLNGHTAQTGDSFARIGAAGAGLTDLGGMSTGMKAEVNAEVWSGGSVNFNDQSGENDATPQNFPAPIPTTAGPLGEDVAVFDGTDDYFTTPVDTTGWTAITMVGWCKPTADLTQAVFGAGTNPMPMVRVHSTGRVRFWPNTTQGNTEASTEVDDGDWHFFGASFDEADESYALIVDDGESNTGTLSGRTVAGNTIELGHYQNNNRFNGPLAYLAVFDTKLSVAQMQALHTAATPAAYKALAISYGAVAYWSMAANRNVNLYESSREETAQTTRAEMDNNSTQMAAILADTAQIGTPAGADIAADIAAIKSDTGNLVTRIPAALFSGITSLAEWLGLMAGKQTGDSTARTEIRATGVGSGMFDETTDSQEAIRDRGDAEWTTGGGSSSPTTLQSTTIATLASQTSFTLAAGSADDDAYNGRIVILTDQSTGTQKAVGVIDDYAGSTLTVALENAPAFTIATGDSVDILAMGDSRAASIDTILARTGQGVTVNTSGQADSDANFATPIKRGVDYNTTAGNAFTWTLTGFPSSPWGTSTTAVLGIKQDCETSYTTVGSVAIAHDGDETLTPTASFTDTETSGLTADVSTCYQLTLTNGSNTRIVTGAWSVID